VALTALRPSIGCQMQDARAAQHPRKERAKLLRREVMRQPRSFVTSGAVAGAVVVALNLTGAMSVSAVVTSAASTASHARAPRSVTAAYRFLGKMLDLRTTSSAPRLVQSFTGGLLGKRHITDSETYDDALIIDAYLARGTAAALAKARIVDSDFCSNPPSRSIRGAATCGSAHRHCS
jgi:hypothetical protein